MPKLFLGLSYWDWLTIGSLIFVAVGTIVPLLRSKSTNVSTDENGLIPVSIFFERKKLELKPRRGVSFWTITLIAGLFGGIVAGIHSIHDAARLNNANLTLQLQVIAISNNVVKTDLKNDELKKPISSVSAIVSFSTRGLRNDISSMFGSAFNGTNLEYAPMIFSTTNLVAFDPLHAERIDLAYGRPERFWTGLPTMFLAQGERPESHSDGTNTLWTLNLVQNPSISSLPKGNVESEAEWNLFEIEASFLPRKTEVLGGKITLTVNQKFFEIPIPPQVAKSRELDWQNFSNNPHAGVIMFGK